MAVISQKISDTIYHPRTWRRRSTYGLKFNCQKEKQNDRHKITMINPAIIYFVFYCEFFVTVAHTGLRRYCVRGWKKWHKTRTVAVPASKLMHQKSGKDKTLFSVSVLWTMCYFIHIPPEGSFRYRRIVFLQRKAYWRSTFMCFGFLSQSSPPTGNGSLTVRHFRLKVCRNPYGASENNNTRCNGCQKLGVEGFFGALHWCVANRGK